MFFNGKSIVSIGKPKHGWAHLHIEDCKGQTFDGALSYIQDIFYDFLHAFHTHLTEHHPVAIFVDEEGPEFTMVISEFHIDIIYEEDAESTELIRFHIDAEDFIGACIRDFQANIKEWETFCYDEDYPPTEEVLAKEHRMIKEILQHLDN